MIVCGHAVPHDHKVSRAAGSRIHCLLALAFRASVSRYSTEPISPCVNFIPQSRTTFDTQLIITNNLQRSTMLF